MDFGGEFSAAVVSDADDFLFPADVEANRFHVGRDTVLIQDILDRSPVLGSHDAPGILGAEV